MKKARLIKQDTKKDKKDLIVNEGFSVTTKVVTAVLMLLALVGMYFVTIPLTKNRKANSNSNTVVNIREENSIKYSEIDKIKEDSYYLFFDKGDDDLNNTYDTYINSLSYNNYTAKFYYIDLSDEANKDLLGDKQELDKISEIKVKDTTLVLVENGEIKSKYVGQSEVSNYLLSFFITASNVTIKTSSDSNSNESDEKVEDKKEEKEDKDKDEDKEDKEDKDDKSDDEDKDDEDED